MVKAKTVPQILRLDVAAPQPLVSDQVHLYVAALADLQADAGEFATYLSAEEQARAARFLDPQHGQKQRLVRGLLRKLLAQYLGIAPQQVEFDYAEHGKPSLRNDPSLCFNLSHSRDMVAYAFRCDYDIGVDIEYMRRQENLPGMIRHVASRAEQQALNSLESAQAQVAFYRLWTRKEAFIKAVGRGLGMGLRLINIGINANDSVLAVEYRNKTLPEWFIKDLPPPQDYKLALCSKYP